MEPLREVSPDVFRGTSADGLREVSKEGLCGVLIEPLRDASTEGLLGASTEVVAGADAVGGLEEFKGRWDADAEANPWYDAGATTCFGGVLARAGLMARLGVGVGVEGGLL